jgi:glycosyltransferase involved in cell wall biosynthesis
MDTNLTPKISVLMPVYNAGPYLAEAIDSILAQTFSDFEFLIIDDGSTDGSGEIVQSYDDPRIRYLRNERNLGLVDTLNRGIELARGPYIARMDADDISLPERFERQIDFMDAHPEAGVCGSSFQFFGDRDFLAVYPSDYREAYTFLASDSCLGHPTAMIRRKILTEHNLRYESEYGYAADYAFWIRIGQVCGLTSLSEPLLLYRWHEANMSRVDPSRVNFRNKVRFLWHELMSGISLTESQKSYLLGDFVDKKVFQEAKVLLLLILQGSASHLIDKKLYGQRNVTVWEQRYIDLYGLMGLLTCLFQPAFHKWSRSTHLGLVAYYLGRYAIGRKEQNQVSQRI